MNSIANAISDVIVMTERNIIRYRRIPQLLVFSTVQPVMFLLLFNYVFGGAITLGGQSADKYIQFLLPGIIIQTALFGSSQASVGIAEDMKSGLIDRLRSLPIAGFSVIMGKVLADTIRNILVVIIMVAVGFLLGFRFGGTILDGMLGLYIAVLFGFAFSWISVSIGLLVKDPEAALPAGFLWIFPLVFASGIFVPVKTMPEWLQKFALNQPVTKAVDATRGLMSNPNGATSGEIFSALAWVFGITAVFLTLSVFL
ncbi:MAG TPA: ABC transporter permease [Candidatus Saccharimonadales bacterium]|nr:ABC transporter permease [Candidatus Saccharimonadales bacterium]